MTEETAVARASRNRARRMKAARARARAAVEARDAELAAARRDIGHLTDAIAATGLAENCGQDVQDAIYGVLGTRDEPAPIDGAIRALQGVLVPLMDCGRGPSDAAELEDALSRLEEVTEDRDGLAQKLSAVGSMLEMQSGRVTVAEAARDRAEARVAQLEAEAVSMRGEISAMRGRAEAAESQADGIDGLASELQAARAESERAAARAAELQGLLETARAEAERAKADAAERDRENEEALRIARRQAGENGSRTDELSREVESLREELARES